MKQKRTGVLIGPALTEKYGWKEGDRVPLKSLLSANRDRATGNLMLRQYSSLKPALLAGLVAALPAPLLADDLRDALNAAYATNPSLQGARAQQRATDETVPIARAAGLPSLQGASSYTEFLKNSANNFTSPDRAFDSSLQLSVPVYSGGGVKNSVLAAETRVKAGQADLRGAESGIFSRVVASYMDVILAEAVVGLNRNNVEVLTVNLRATRDRFEIGDLTRTDVAQSQARLALAQGDLRSAQSSLIAAREFYLSIVGKPPVALQPPPPLAGLPDTPAEATQIALDNNPDLIAARQRSTAAGFDVKAVSASRLPRISVFTGLGYTDYLGTLGGTAAGTMPLPRARRQPRQAFARPSPCSRAGFPQPSAVRHRRGRTRRWSKRSPLSVRSSPPSALPLPLGRLPTRSSRRAKAQSMLQLSALKGCAPKTASATAPFWIFSMPSVSCFKPRPASSLRGAMPMSRDSRCSQRWAWPRHATSASMVARCMIPMSTTSACAARCSTGTVTRHPSPNPRERLTRHRKTGHRLTCRSERRHWLNIR